MGLSLFLVPVSPLFTVFGFLSGRATAVSTSDVLFLLGFGPYLVIFLARPTAASEVDAVLQYLLEITLLAHRYIFL